MNGSDGAVEPQQPLLRVVRGNATPEDVAALLGVVMAMGSAHSGEQPDHTSPWAATARKGRYLPRPSASAWQLSLRNT